MEISKGIRAKLFLLFIVMGGMPFIILVTAGALNTLTELEEFVKQNSLLKNTIISKHVSEIIEKNQAVLQSLALSPNVISYLQNPTEEKRQYVEKILRDTDDIFDDSNSTALTGSDGWQLIRTDGSKPVNLQNRQHFQEAMKGRSFVSDIISSMSTGKLIIVMEVPVLNYEGQPIGMVQRNFNLESLQDFVRTLDESENSIIIMDRTGRVISNSETKDDEEDFIDNTSYKFILDRIYNSSGVIRLDIKGEDSLATYSRNLDTGWMIVTIRPYHFITEQVVDKAAKAIIFGLVMLFFGTIVAYLLTMRVTKPIIEMTEVVDKIASGEKIEVPHMEVKRDDELGQMAAAFNKLRSERDSYQLESELDKLTELFNKKTMENLCKMKLKTFNENENSNILLAFYIIDLDHFKEVNDLLGHQFGDKVLAEFARGLKKIFRPNDCIGRFGGDEFVVIVDSLPNMEVVIRKAEQIKQIAYNLTIDEKSRFVTASIGIAIAPQNGRDYDSLFAAADKAVYHVKNNGKNGYYCELFAEEDY